MTDLDRTADACVAAALRRDPEGLAALLHGLDNLELKKLAIRLATHASDALTDWAAESGVTPEQATEIWQRGIILREQQRSNEADG